MTTRVSLGIAFALLLSATASSAATEPVAAKIARAVSAGPASIAAKATVLDMDASGKATVLRKGSNGWTCIAGHKGVVGDDPMCADAAAMQWAADWMGHKPKPTNTKPGIVYMYAGGTDWSADDPYASKGTPITEPAHWMIMWPFDLKASGIPSKVANTGTWVMWAGTPYAHLMINGKAKS